MTIRLERAALYADAAAALHGVPDAGELLDPMPADATPRIPLVPDTDTDDGPRSTPAAHVLRTASRLLAARGWCRDAMRDRDGRLCLAAAVREAAGGDRLAELSAAEQLLDHVRREFADPSETVPHTNDHLVRDQAHAVALLNGAALAPTDTR